MNSRWVDGWERLYDGMYGVDIRKTDGGNFWQADGQAVEGG